MVLILAAAYLVFGVLLLVHFYSEKGLGRNNPLNSPTRAFWILKPFHAWVMLILGTALMLDYCGVSIWRGLTWVIGQ